MHDSRTVANRFIALAGERGLTPMQLLKLVYIAHGWRLALAGRPLIRDSVQAWQYGPVIPPLYNALRSYRDKPVCGQISAPANDALDESEEALIKQVFDIYGHLSGIALSRLTHAPNTPWDHVYVPKSFGLHISNDMIQDHYKMLAQSRS